ncbi:MAG: hypothetical protein AAFR75_02630 [Pseudomonadota bacterium]
MRAGARNFTDEGKPMIVLRVFVNALIMAIELAAVVGAAWLGIHYPLIFACLTAALAFLIGLYLDYARLRHEFPFYFNSDKPRFVFGLRLVAFLDSALKGLTAGLIALLTFSGTDSDRTFLIAIVFGVATYFGLSILRRLSISLGARPERWGFFRLAVPMGLVFSSGVALLAALGHIKVPTLYDLGKQIVFDTPEQPGIDALSDLLFNLKQYIDSMIATLLNTFLPADYAQVVSLIISVNVLTGFVIAVYAVAITMVVQAMEKARPF